MSFEGLCQCKETFLKKKMSFDHVEDNAKDYTGSLKQVHLVLERIQNVLDLIPKNKV